jgi:hypothetical protein
VGTQLSQKPAKAKKGTPNLVAATNVGGLRLEVGEYIVKQLNYRTDLLSSSHAIPTIPTHKRVYLRMNGKLSAK